MHTGRFRMTKTVLLTGLLMMCSSCVQSMVTPCFTPGNNCVHLLKHEIDQARTEILVQTDMLTSQPIADAIAKAKESGVHVEVILDKSSRFTQNSGTFFSSLKSIPTYVDGNHVRADNNMIIIDRQTVITGTYEFTNDAEVKNAESLLIIRSDSVAGSYINNWNEHKGHSEEFRISEPEPQVQPEPQPKQKTDKPDKKKADKKKKKP
jgi:phosphatidylserine/phosphatidylglycerophosphate/cardiolipin synthase-like enzyme